MSFEQGEKVRICAIRKQQERERFLSYTKKPSFVRGSAPAAIAYNHGYRPKSEDELICPEDCPGIQLVKRRLGPIPLPVIKEVCPMDVAS